MRSFKKIVDAWLTLRPKTTRRKYLKYLESWEAFLRGRRPTPSLAVDFIGGLKGKSDATILNYYQVLRSIYSYLQDLGLVNDNPFRRVKRMISFRARRQVRPTKLIAPQKVRRILALTGETFEELRDSCLMTLFFCWGFPAFGIASVDS